MRAIDEFLQDAYFALRMLRKSRVFSTVAVATIALGMGVNTAVFGVINAIIFRPLPVKDSARLVVIATFRAGTPTLRPVPLRNSFLSLFRHGPMLPDPSE